MKLRQQFPIRQGAKFSHKPQLILPAGAGRLGGPTMAILAMKIDFKPNPPASPAIQEQPAPGDGDTHRRPPSSLQGGTLRSVPEDSLRLPHSSEAATPNK